MYPGPHVSPAGHAEQAEEPLVAANVPAVQVVHVVTPEREYAPEPQTPQAVLPVRDAYVPAAHVEHIPAPLLDE